MTFQDTAYPTLVLKRRNGPDWKFNYEQLDVEISDPNRPYGYIHQTKDNIYQLFIDSDAFADVWVGRYVCEGDKNIWYTVDRGLGAVQVQFGRGTYIFR